MINSIVYAWHFMLCPVEKIKAMPGEKFAKIYFGLIVFSAIISACMIGIFTGLTSIILENSAGQTSQYFIAGFAAMLFFLLGPYSLAHKFSIKFLSQSDQTKRMIFTVAIMLGSVIFLSALRHEYYRFEYELPGFLEQLRPDSKIFRVLIIMPLWGMWAMMVLLQFSRPSLERCSPSHHFAKGCGPLRVAITMGALIAISICFFAFMPWTQLIISAAAIATALIAGSVLKHLNGKLDRTVLLATNLLTQLAVLASYIAVRDIRFS